VPREKNARGRGATDAVARHHAALQACENVPGRGAPYRTVKRILVLGAAAKVRASDGPRRGPAARVAAERAECHATVESRSDKFLVDFRYVLWARDCFTTYYCTAVAWRAASLYCGAGS
jgi:hypothetical protein